MSRQASFSTVDPARGRRLLEARERVGLQQLEVAASLEVSRGTLRRWERGHWLSAGSLGALAALYGVPEDELSGEEADRPLLNPAPVSTEWPHFARAAWARLQLELVEAGWDDGTIAFLRGFVLAPELRLVHLTDESALRLDVQAGLAAARAWIAARAAHS
jgi:transcriptional regulator with XRE-family HTH domain